jgi:hypothetical protein
LAAVGASRETESRDDQKRRQYLQDNIYPGDIDIAIYPGKYSYRKSQSFSNG